MTSSNGFLLDTNVVSELQRRRPHPGVLTWLNTQDSEALFLSVLTVGELRRGVARLTLRDPGRSAAVARWIERLVTDFEDRLLSIDHITARVWGETSASRSRPVTDALLAATALVNNLTLATRNVKDFDFHDLQVINPFESHDE